MKKLIQKLQSLSDNLQSGNYKEELERDILLLKTTASIGLCLEIKNKYDV
jgi:hypothetical protein